MISDSLTWPDEAVCIRPTTLDVPTIAEGIYDRTCRTDFDAPGFCVVNVGTAIGSVEFRRLMVDLVRAMAGLHESRTGATLQYVSAGRFDQQETTKLHLDGGPDESFLMLGYEPTAIVADFFVADHARCAFDLGMTPGEFMARHNPMFDAGAELQRGYTTRLPCFPNTDWRIVCVNNSSAPFTADGSTWQGTLHAASIPAPDESERRIVNSTLITPAPVGTPERVGDPELHEFVRGNAASGNQHG